MTTLLAPERVLWAPEMTTVCLLLEDGLSRSKARYQGYREVDFEVGIGAFYPSDWRVRKVWLRRDLRPGPESEFTHMVCPSDHPEAVAYWQVSHLEQPKEWRDGRWRQRTNDALEATQEKAQSA